MKYRRCNPLTFLIPLLVVCAVSAYSQPQMALTGVRGSETDRTVITFTDQAGRDGVSPLRQTVIPQMPDGGDLPVPQGAVGIKEPPGLSGLGYGVLALPSPPTAANFAALGDNGTMIPPDVQGAAGPNHLMVTLNSQVAIQNRTGGLISSQSLQNFWSTLGPFSTTTGVFDPRVMYDPYRSRWIHVAAADPIHAKSALLIGVTQTSNPTGTWYLFKIDVDPGDTLWADYPTIGFNKKWIVVELNMYKIGGGFTKSHVYAFDKDSLYANVSAKHTLLKLTGEGGTQAPAATYSSTQDTMFFVKSFNGNFGGLGYLRMYTLTGNVGSEVLTIGSFITTPNPWDYAGNSSWADFAPQLGTSNKIMNNDDRMQNLVYRNGFLWCTHTIFLPAGASTRSAAQWWQLTTTGGIVQRGRIDDAVTGMFYAFPSVAVNSRNDVLIGYSRFSSSQYASGNYSYRASTDPVNTLRSDVVLKAGVASYYKTFGAVPALNRWGDYSETVVDPVNDVDMWTIQEYAATPSGGTDRWGTWWGYITPTPSFAVSPASLNFGSVTIGLSKTDSVKVSNSGYTTLTIDSVRSSNTVFTVLPISGSVGAGDSQYYKITFTPTTPGASSGSIVFYHTGSTSPDTVSVTGITGISIIAVTPSVGVIGAPVTITGGGFSAVPGNNIVYFGGVRAFVSAASTTSLSVTVPPGATYAPVSVTTGGLTAYSPMPFTVIFPTGTGLFDTASFAAKVDFPASTNPWGMCMGDIDGDGKLDVLVANSGSNILSAFLNTSAGSSIVLAPRLDFATGAGPRNVTMGDLDNDGMLDVAVASGSSNIISMFRNVSTSGLIIFAPRVDSTVGNNPFDVAIGEIDGDGKPDVVTANGSAFSVLRNTGTPGTISFAARLDFASGTNTRSVALSDFDGDGLTDVAALSIGTATVTVFRNTSTPGSISFAAGISYATGTAPYEVVVVDADSDGKLDLAVANVVSNTVSVFQNQCTTGSITFAMKTDFATGNGPACLVAENLNGDSKPDILTSNNIDSTISVLRNTSASISFASKMDYRTGDNPYGCTSGDMNNDGAPELLTANQGNNTVSVLRNRLTDQYGISASAVGGGSIIPSGSVMVYHGANQSFTMTPDTGHHIDSILVDGVNVGSTSPYNFTNLTAAHSITVYFSINVYTLAITAVHGSVQKNPDQTSYTHGASVELTAVPDTDYSFVSWSGDATGSDNPTTIVMDTNKSVTAIFSNLLVITASAIGPGEIVPSGFVEIEPGGDTTFTMIPDTGSVLDSLVVDDVIVDSISSYTFTNVTTNHTIKAYFGITQDTTVYRTATYQDWAKAVDGKNKQKPIKRKNDKVQYKFELVAPAAGDLEVKLGMLVDGIYTLSTPPETGTYAATKVIMVSGVDGGEVVQFSGYGQKGKVLKVKYEWTNPPKTKGSIETFIENMPRLPIPNLNNVIEEVFGGPKKLPQPNVYPGGLLIGVPQGEKGAFSVKALKDKDVWKSLIKKGAPHTTGGICLTNDKKQLKSLPPDKYNNLVFGDVIALKLNVGASFSERFPNGLGELTFDDPSDPTNPFNGMMVKNILLAADTLLSCVSLLGNPAATIGVLQGVVEKINEAFADSPYVVDTLQFAVGTKMTGVRQLKDVDFLSPTPGVVPAHILPDAPLEPSVPDVYTLDQNYPNPFNPVTTIGFTLTAEACVTLKVYNVLGQEIATLLNREMFDEGAGEVEFDAQGLASGIYFYRLIVEELDEEGMPVTGWQQMKKMALVK